MCTIFKVNGKIHIKELISSIVIAEGVGALSGFLSMSNVKNYSNLKKPFFSPPGFIFPIVWVILYFLMAVAAYRIWVIGKEESKDVKKALVLYAVQLLFNFLWSIIFFKFNCYGAAFIELLILLFFILCATFQFHKHDKVAAFLMIPYILWVSFAGILNFAIWFLNRNSST
ncbi:MULTISPECIES: TspO/MBR family protein [Clostridium]|uniref:Tryptophan-rich possible sensory protein, TSPO homolog n=1 Tax=Clostridium acetobutylicum (strain ATCC 824 / DSM 792 / JCM 1419 / IAM 19013 / LMG 5710 / NBRC 13948 / NRRL B-527 / VKM B-1787 / 2291 / W) TaxID=272562 RepID=Q97MD6_CLOAB|nr:MULTISPECIES: TspO/MBR family protein [Clostridium]AAK78243.1 Tryptophan-rich possible sensory protein, TSPO homolog [Clostridium acetobutylicum ATCC 824]ADZ19309.1 Tryptophan-rich possible sensory protein [Clostridium acetobutylicum EA 2018]AEI34247.1 tryptophan-rich sensory protein, TSPO-like protein [Clostridium acetobutylicum DSM 1731]AWV82050.1 tryptophan-rich sensory protein [Clostridium acetobutylicum]MBC2396096.1 TspO/MBR family protein [Clostridium acetobutylicum]